MKKIAVIVLVPLAVVAAIAAGLAVFLKVKYPPDRLKALVNDQAEKHLHRQVKLESVSIGVFKGLSVTGFELSERPNFQAGRFVASRFLSVKPFLLPLLRGEVVVKSIDLTAPEIRVVRYVDKTLNFSDLASPEKPAAGTGGSAKPAAAAPKIFVNHLSVRDGTVIFADKSPAGISLGVRALNLSVDSFSFLTPFTLALSCDVDGSLQGKPLAGRVRATGRLSLIGGGRAELKTLGLEVLGSSLEAAGTVNDFSAPAMDLTLQIKSFNAKTLAPFVTLPPELADALGSGTLAVKGNFQKSAVTGDLKISAAGWRSTLNLAADVSGTPLSFDGKIGFSDLNAAGSPWLPDLAISGPLKGSFHAKGTANAVTMDADVDGDTAEVRYAALASKKAGSALRFHAKAELKVPFDNPVFLAEGRVEKLQLVSGPPLPADLRLNGAVDMDFSAMGTLTDASLRLNLQGGDLAASYGTVFEKQAGTPLSLAAEAAVKNQTNIQLSASQISLGPLILNSRGAIGDFAGSGRMDISVQAAAFPIDGLAAYVPLLKEYPLSGKAGFHAAVQGTFTAPTAQGTLSLAGLNVELMKGVSVTDLTGDVAFTENSAATDNLNGKFNGSELSLKGRTDGFSRMDMRCDGSLSRLDMGPLTASFGQSSVPPAQDAGSTGAPPGPASPAAPAPIARTRGTFHLGSVVHPNYTGRNFRLMWDLTEMGTDIGRSNGTADFAAEDGKIHDLPLAAKINKLLKKDASEIPYKSMSGHFKITDGVLDTQDFTVAADQADILAKGIVNLVTLTADLRAIFKLRQGAVGGSVGDWFAGEDGRPTLEAVLKGPLSDPAIQVDVARAAKRAAEDLLRKGLEKLKQDYGSGTPPAEGAPAEPLKNEQRIDKALEKGQKALDKLFRKK